MPQHVLEKMAGSLVHRGPDEEGYYFNRATIDSSPANPRRTFIGHDMGIGAACPAVGLAHRRLSIVDLASGQQPLCNEDGSIWIVFNGEIYNFKELRSELQEHGHQFRTNSDTEVIVHAYEEWGSNCLTRFNGMFAFAIWDEMRELLFIGRDRIGKKPLYYCLKNDSLVFGSELKAVLSYPGIDTQIDATAVVDYFKYLYIPDPKTIFQGICKLPPAHYLVATKNKVAVLSPGSRRLTNWSANGSRHSSSRQKYPF